MELLDIKEARALLWQEQPDIRLGEALSQPLIARP